MRGNFSSLNGKRILVTGHTGFKGAWLCSLLRSLGADVYGLALEPAETSLYRKISRLDSTHEFIGDIRNTKDIRTALSMSNPEVIIHMAAQALVSESYRNPLETFQTNVIGTANLLEESNKIDNLKILIAITTDKVYLNKNNGQKFSENDPLGGSDPYSASKSAMEMALVAWRYFYEQKGKQLISVRAGNVIGPGDRAANRLIPDLIESIRRNEPTIIRNPNSTRPWQHVLEPIFGYLLVAVEGIERRLLSNAFNFGPNDHSSLTVGEVATFVCSSMNFHSGWVHSPNQLGIPESDLLALDSKLAERELGWISLLDGREAISWTLQGEKAFEKNKAEDVIQRQIKEYFEMFYRNSDKGNED